MGRVEGRRVGCDSPSFRHELPEREEVESHNEHRH